MPAEKKGVTFFCASCTYKQEITTVIAEKILALKGLEKPEGAYKIKVKFCPLCHTSPLSGPVTIVPTEVVPA